MAHASGVAGAVALSLCLAVAPRAQAQDFWAGKALTILVGSGVGGGFDLYGRTVARHIVRYLPGRPNAITQNMPGAGSTKAAEFVYNQAPKDGTTIAIVFPGAIVEPLLGGRDKYRFDPPKFEFLGSANSGARLCITFGTSSVKTFEDARTKTATMGGSAPGDSTTDYANLLNSLAGSKFKVVNGYKSTADILLAMERSELDGVCGLDASSLQAQRPAWFGTPTANMILQASLEPREELEKLGAPSIWKYVSGERRTVAELILAQQEFHRPFIAPPGTPAPRMGELRKAFEATMKDAEFLSDAQKSNLEVAPKTGAEVATLVQKMYASPEAIVVQAQKALRP